MRLCKNCLTPVAFYFSLVQALFSLDNSHCQLISTKSVISLVFACAVFFLFFKGGFYCRTWLRQDSSQSCIGKLKFYYSTSRIGNSLTRSLKLSMRHLQITKERTFPIWKPLIIWKRFRGTLEFESRVNEKFEFNQCDEEWMVSFNA